MHIENPYLYRKRGDNEAKWIKKSLNFVKKTSTDRKRERVLASSGALCAGDNLPIELCCGFTRG
jgi:hypothetical protein